MKKLLSFVVLICITIGFSSNVFAVDYDQELKTDYEQKFSDVPSSYWAFSYIAEMEERGILSGYPDGKFYPNSQVTRAEFAKIMTIAAELSVTEPTMQIFSDVQITDWYAPYIHTAKEYLSAYNKDGSNYYLPNTPALREDIAVALVKLKGYSMEDVDVTTLSKMFSDYQSISENAKIYVASAIENRLISGYDDGTFRGQNGITRAEAATLLWRAYQYDNANDVQKNDTITKKDGKPYVLTKIADVDIKNVAHATIDNVNDIYYIDENDNCVYRIDIATGTVEKFFDAEDIAPHEKVEYPYGKDGGAVTNKYSSYVATQVYYDFENSKMLMYGYFEEHLWNQEDSNNGKYWSLYDISYGNSELLCFVGDVAFDSYDQRSIQTVVSEKMFVDSSLRATINRGLLFDMHTEEFTHINSSSFPASSLKSGNAVYSLKMKSSKIMLDRYNFLDGSLEQEIAGFSVSAYALKDDYYYFVTNYGIIKYDVKTGATSELDVDFESGVEFDGIASINYFSPKFFVIDDETFVFYDKNMKAFRILKKNEKR